MIEFGWQAGASAPVNRPVAPQPGEIAVAAPPVRARAAPAVTPARLLPVAMAAIMIVVSVVAYRSGSPAARNPILAAFPAMMLLSAIVTAVTGRTAGRASIDDDRDDYLAYLAGLRATVTGTASAQRSALSWAHPEPDALWTLAGSVRMGERRPDDPDFGRVRVGVGSVPLTTRLIRPPTDRAGGIDPVTDTALRNFLDTYATVPEVPVAVQVLGPDPVRVDGEPDRARGLLRAMICQLAVLHPPEALLIAVVADSHTEHWEWLKWLPHHQHPSALDSAGTARLTYPTLAAAQVALAGLAGRVVLVVDDDAQPWIGASGADAAAAGLRLRVSDAEPTGCGVANAAAVQPDFLAAIDAEVCARRLAGSRPARRGGAATGWPGLLGIADLTAVDAQALWDSVRPPDRLCVPIGTDSAGNPVRLDIKEAAQQGSGPHGLCIGATGSGKSEFLRTVVLGMMARHSPETLNLVLVDFKGGATFLGLQHAGHVAAVITNLAEEAVLVDRMRDALTGELTRRQELLRTKGCGDVNAYAQARRIDASLPALPTLLVVVDEFSELLSQHPDFIDVFVAIGRLGRSLGVHLLLASQRLDEGRLRGLESHLSYRICLKTMSATESRLVLGVPDAHELPTTPGRGYLRTAGGELTGFQAAFVSGACPRTEPAPPEPRRGVRLFTAAPGGPPGSPGTAPDGRTVLQAMLARLSGHGPPARQVWLPPLDESPALGGLLDGEQRDLVVPIGIVDRPFEQRRTPLLVDLGGSAGNVAVVGAPQSGKSTALVTLISALPPPTTRSWCSSTAWTSAVARSARSATCRRWAR